LKKIIFILFVLLFSLSACLEKTENSSDSVNLVEDYSDDSVDLEKTKDSVPKDFPEVTLSITSDKNTYSSHEPIVFTITANCSEAIEDAVIRVYGIRPRSAYYLDNFEVFDLEKGINTVTFDETTPNCTSGCGGVYPGPYDVNVSLELNNKLLAEAQTIIELVKG